jgi:protein-tyrosine phosphatase
VTQDGRRLPEVRKSPRANLSRNSPAQTELRSLDQFSIVFICSGNRFRSPLAEAFVRELTVGLPIDVQSFGTLPVGAAPPLPEAFKLAQLCSVDVSTHRARLVGTQSLEQTDLVIGFEAEHVREAVIEGKASQKLSFTFREIVGLLEDAPAPEAADPTWRGRQAVQWAVRNRSAKPSDDDAIRDPFGRSRRVYYETAAEIRELSIRLVGALFGITDSITLSPLPPQGFRPWSRLKR